MVVQDFVGRAGEVRALSELTEACRRGDSRIAFVMGDPGTGKTALLQHLGDQARRSGFRVLAVSGDGGDVAVPYGPLQQALAEVDDGRDPIIGQALSMIADRSTGDQRTRRHECVDGVRRLVEHWAARSPVLVAVDDLHAADADTVAVVMTLVRSLSRQRVAMVLSARPAQLPIGLAEHVRRAVTLPRVCELELHGLDVDDLAELVRARTGRAPDVVNVRALQLRSGGVPFFAVELVDALHASGVDLSVRADLADLPLPRRVSTAILHRVSSLGPDARTVASVSSVLASVPVDLLEMLSELTSLPLDRTAGALDDLAVSGVLVQVEDGYRFRHDLVRQALYDDLPPAIRRTQHTRIADGLSRRRRADHPRQILEIATHVRLGVGDRDDAAAALLREAGDTVLLEDPRQAVGWYRAALARVAPDADVVPDLQFCVSEALDLSGDQAESARIGAIALRSLPPGPVRERGVAVVAHAAFAMGSLARAGALLDDALADSATRSGRLLLHRARVRLWQGRLDDAASDLLEARQRGLGHLTDVGDCVQMDLALQRGEAARGIELAARLRDRLEDMRPSVRLDVHLSLRLAAAISLSPADAVTDEAGTETSGAMATWHETISAHALLRLGRLRDALASADRADAGIGSQPSGAQRSVILAVQIRALTELGDLARADAVRERAGDRRHVLAVPALSECAAARLDSVRGRHDEAIAVLERAVEAVRPTGRVNLLATTLGELAECAVAAERTQLARDAASWLRSLPLDGHALAANLNCWLAQAIVERDEGAADAARQAASAHGLALDAARALAVLGDLRGDVDALRRAHDELGACGAMVRQQHVNALLRRHGSHSPKGQRRHGRSLTATEVQIAHLVAEGLANREIAERLHLSPKTIEVYLSRVFALSGCRSRVQLAVAVQRGELATAGASISAEAEGNPYLRSAGRRRHLAP